MKRVLLLCSLLLALPAVGACNGSGTPNIQLSTMPAEEIMDAQDVIPFRLHGKVQDDEIYVVSIEHYKEGYSLGNSTLTFRDLTSKSDMGFGVTSDLLQNSLTFSFLEPNGFTSLTIDGTTAFGAIGTMLQGKVNVPLGEPVYIAYWLGSDDGTFIYSSPHEEGYDSLKENKLCYLVKVERQKWSELKWE
ncbi:hypothetical protein HNO89_002351 [Sporosarcina luteola]|nr:hypothetical protein [Sporosarcina luteola]